MVAHSTDSESLNVHTEQELIGCTLYEQLYVMVLSSEPEKNDAIEGWNISDTGYRLTIHSLVPRPSPLFVIWFMSSIMHKKKTEKAWEHLSHE